MVIDARAIMEAERLLEHRKWGVRRVWFDEGLAVFCGKHCGRISYRLTDKGRKFALELLEWTHV